jgi:hypothetical protein
MKQAPLTVLPPRPQFQAGAESRLLLVRNAPWGDVMVDLYGDLDDDGYSVEDVALAGSPVSLAEWFLAADLAELSRWCDRHLPSAARLRADAAAEERIP